jgi:hypothetical protein
MTAITAASTMRLAIRTLERLTSPGVGPSLSGRLGSSNLEECVSEVAAGADGSCVDADAMDARGGAVRIGAAHPAITSPTMQMRRRYRAMRVRHHSSNSRRDVRATAA